MPVVIAGLIVAFLAMMLFGGSDLDRAIMALLDGAPTPRLDNAALFVAWLAHPYALIGIGLAGTIVPLLARRWRDAACLAALLLSGWLLIRGAHMLTEQIRVPLPIPGQRDGGQYPDGRSALSAVTGFGLAFLATRHFPARLIALIAAAAFVLCTGSASLLLATSWPSGVIGGWALGLAWTLLLLRLAGTDLGDGDRRLRPNPRAQPTVSVPRSSSGRPEHQAEIVGRHLDEPRQHQS